MDHQSAQTRQLADDALYRDRIGNAFPGAIIHEVLDIPLATIKAQTSGAAFAIRAALPANTRLLRSELGIVQAVILPGDRQTCAATVQGGTDAAGSILASSNVEILPPGGFIVNIGSDPYQTRGGQVLFMTLTSSEALSLATAGHLQVGIYYTILP